MNVHFIRFSTVPGKYRWTLAFNKSAIKGFISSISNQNEEHSTGSSKNELKVDDKLYHRAIVPRVNRFAKPVLAWIRDFQSFKPFEIISISGRIFNAPIRVDIMHRVVHWYRCSLRQGTASSLRRGEVRGSGAKIRQQKGTGKARAGTIRAPQRRGGGRCFGPKPRSFKYHLANGIKNLALRSAFSTKYSQGLLSFVSNKSIELEDHKTTFLNQIVSMIPGKKILLIGFGSPPRNLALAIRSLSKKIVYVDSRTADINAYHILNSSIILMTQKAKDFYESTLNPVAIANVSKAIE